MYVKRKKEKKGTNLPENAWMGQKVQLEKQ